MIFALRLGFFSYSNASYFTSNCCLTFHWIEGSTSLKGALLLRIVPSIDFCFKSGSKFLSGGVNFSLKWTKVHWFTISRLNFKHNWLHVFLLFFLFHIWFRSKCSGHQKKMSNILLCPLQAHCVGHVAVISTGVISRRERFSQFPAD